MIDHNGYTLAYRSASSETQQRVILRAYLRAVQRTLRAEQVHGEQHKPWKTGRYGTLLRRLV